MANPFLLRISLFFFILFFTLWLKAQDYKGAVGIRFGYGWGLSGKGVLGPNGHVLEGLIRYGYHGVIFTQPGVNFACLYEKHFDFGRNKNWAFLLGGGPSIGFGRNGSNRLYTFGFSPILGFDVTARQLPFDFSVDYKPSIFLDRAFGNRNFHQRTITYYEVALSVRYAIK